MILGLNGCLVQLSRDAELRTEVARYHEGTLGIVGPKQMPRLEVDPSVEHMLDLIVLTFLYVEKLRGDMEGLPEIQYSYT